MWWINSLYWGICKLQLVVVSAEGIQFIAEAELELVSTKTEFVTLQKWPAYILSAANKLHHLCFGLSILYSCINVCRGLSVWHHRWFWNPPWPASIIGLSCGRWLLLSTISNLLLTYLKYLWCVEHTVMNHSDLNKQMCIINSGIVITCNILMQKC